MIELTWTATELAERIRTGQTTVMEAVEASLEQIHACEPACHHFVTVMEEEARAQSEEVQRGIQEGIYTGPLAGVPVAVKDNLCTKGVETTCGSRILKGYLPPYEAEAIRRLRQAGAVIVGKTNMDEFAMGNTTETSAYGPAKNPWNLSHVPGGSSGGSGGAVATGAVFAALGSDTGGSIRQPSAHCGILGCKPTYGTVSRYGLVAYASSLDQIGPMARSVEDLAAILEIISGRDEKDATSIPRSDLHFREYTQTEIRGMRIGIPRQYFGEGLSQEVACGIRGMAQELASQGALVEEFDLDLVSYGIPAYYTIASAEASSNLARFDGVKYGYRAPAYEGLHDMYKKTRSQGFGPEVKRRILLGSFVLSEGYYEAYYQKAMKIRTLIKEAFDRAFAVYDLILGPVAPTTAPLLGTLSDDPLHGYLEDIYTVAVNLAGLPAISVPCGWDSQGLPIGAQLIANSFEEKKLLAAAHVYEERHPISICPMGWQKEESLHE